MDFEPSDRVKRLKGKVDRMIAEVVEPLEEEHADLLGGDMEQTLVGDDGLIVDRYWDVADEIRAESVERGLYNVVMPEEYGGLDLSWLEFEQVIEHMHDRRNPGFHRHVIVHTSTPMLFMFDDSLWDEYVEPITDGEMLMCFAMTEEGTGSDPQYMDARAHKDGDEWVVNGTKKFVTQGPYADIHVVFARTSGDPGDTHGITGFVVDDDQDGVEMGEMQKVMGGIPRDHCYMHYDDVRVPERKVLGEVGEGLTSGMEWINYGKVYDAARAVGQAQWVLDKTVDYAKNRETWDVPLSERQAVRHTLADMDRQVKRARWLTRRTAWELDRADRPWGWQAAMKVEEANVLNDVVDDALQIHGGRGYERDNPVEWLYRHARVYRIWEGADEVMKDSHARQLVDEGRMDDV